MESIKNYILYVHDDVNYNAIFIAQIMGIFICIMLYILQEYYSNVFEGYFVIFLPFIPAAIRQYFIRERWKNKMNKKTKKE